jgi:hypothetical protein
MTPASSATAWARRRPSTCSPSAPRSRTPFSTRAAQAARHGARSASPSRPPTSPPPAPHLGRASGLERPGSTRASPAPEAPSLPWAAAKSAPPFPCAGDLYPRTTPPPARPAPGGALLPPCSATSRPSNDRSRPLAPPVNQPAAPALALAAQPSWARSRRRLLGHAASRPPPHRRHRALAHPLLGPADRHADRLRPDDRLREHGSELCSSRPSCS